MNKLRFVMRKETNAADGQIKYVRILQELVDQHTLGGITTYEWRDVPCEMEEEKV